MPVENESNNERYTYLRRYDPGLPLSKLPAEIDIHNGGKDDLDRVRYGAHLDISYLLVCQVGLEDYGHRMDKEPEWDSLGSVMLLFLPGRHIRWLKVPVVRY